MNSDEYKPVPAETPCPMCGAVNPKLRYDPDGPKRRKFLNQIEFMRMHDICTMVNIWGRTDHSKEIKQLEEKLEDIPKEPRFIYTCQTCNHQFDIQPLIIP